MPPLVEVPCQLCGSSKSKELFKTRNYLFKCTDDVFALRKCECGCGYLSPRPREQDISIYYPKEFYWSWESSQSDITWEEVISKRQAQLQEKAKWLSDNKPGRLLDIGAQKGDFIWYMRELG